MMPHINTVTPEKADVTIKEIYKTVEKKMGRLFNMFQGMGNSPAVLEGYLTLSEAANKTSLPPKLREQIALVVGQANQCKYCLSAHTAIGSSIGLSSDQILEARKGISADPKTQAILNFAKQVVENRSKIDDTEIKVLKAAGVSDKEIVEIIMLVVLNIFTNYFNTITNTVVDFPDIPSLS
jgi:uncharacterized peroxidase-related enzyme